MKGVSSKFVSMKSAKKSFKWLIIVNKDKKIFSLIFEFVSTFIPSFLPSETSHLPVFSLLNLCVLFNYYYYMHICIYICI